MKKFTIRRTWVLLGLVLCLLLVTAADCSRRRPGHYVPIPSNPDTTAPAVTAVVPLDNATGVAINTQLAATFSEAMAPATLTTAFTLKQGATAVTGTVAYSGLTATFTPNSNLAAGATYTATITTGAKDLAGNALASSYAWSFTTTGAAPDLNAPTVTFTDPANGATGVALNKKISATFSEAMDPATLTTATFTLRQGATVVAGTVDYSGVTAVFSLADYLSAGTVYTATITTGATDLDGDALASNYVWSFTTGAAIDATAPRVTSTVPAGGYTGVSIGTKLTATFSEAMDPLTLNTATFTLKRGATAVSGTVAYSGVSAVFTPSSPLLSSTFYTATITTGAEDLAGNALGSNFVWIFDTGAAPDTTAPTVIATIPADDAGLVPIGNKLTATFSEAMDPLTLTTATFTLKRGATAVLGTVAYSGITASFRPLSPLSSSTFYTATITTGTEDTSGNALAANYEWSFTTGAAADTTAPTVILVNPDDGDIDVPINKTIAATFSEAMDHLTITTDTFMVAGVEGTVAYNPITGIATFNPTDDLAPDTTFDATITTGAEDLAGNALAADYTWSFTTGAEALPPIVDLGAAAPFGCFGGGAGVTNEGLLTVINGDLGTTGAATLITGFHDNIPVTYTVTPLNNGWVNGTIYTAGAPEAVNGALDARTAYNNLTPASMPGGTDPGDGQLGGLTLPPGIYQAAGGSFMLTGSDLTLDGEGDANAFWVFQMASSLTVGAPAAPRSIHLIRGAQSKNIFWQVGSAATINPGGGGTMEGTIIAEAGVTFSTSGSMIITTLNGRALGLNASVTMVNTIVNIPAP